MLSLVDSHHAKHFIVLRLAVENDFVTFVNQLTRKNVDVLHQGTSRIDDL